MAMPASVSGGGRPLARGKRAAAMPGSGLSSKGARCGPP
jgi:hypothetical protein